MANNWSIISFSAPDASCAFGHAHTCWLLRCPIFPLGSPHRLWGNTYMLYPIHLSIMMPTSISCVEDSRCSRYSTTTRPSHLHNELSKTLGGTAMCWGWTCPRSLIAELALVCASTEHSHVFGQQRASCSARHSKVVHILHRYALSSQGQSPFSKRAVQFIQKANENSRPRSARGPERSPRQVRELISLTIIRTADLLSMLSLPPVVSPSRASSRPNPGSSQKSLPITRTSSQSPPWETWTFDQDFLRTVKEWNKVHPDNTLDRILNGTCAVIDQHNVLLEMIPNGPIPICGFVKALVHLVKLGAVGDFHRHHWYIILKWYRVDNGRGEGYGASVCAWDRPVGWKIGGCFWRFWGRTNGFTDMG